MRKFKAKFIARDGGGIAVVTSSPSSRNRVDKIRKVYNFKQAMEVNHFYASPDKADGDFAISDTVRVNDELNFAAANGSKLSYATAKIASMVLLLN